MLRNPLAIEYLGNRHWPSERFVAATEIGSGSDLPALSEVQQARQVLIHRRGVELVRSARQTSRIEARETGQLTDRQSDALRSQQRLAEERRLKTLVQNFQTRQRALQTAA